VASKLIEKDSQVKILVLNSYNNSQYISAIHSNGVAGYLTKDEAPAILVKAVHSVANGEKGWFSRDVASKISGWHPKTIGN
jgi:DNA-binding NarL/FixJ family response regulator